MDQGILADPGVTTNGFFTKEGGTPVFVKAPQGHAFVEALYFSRSYEYDWKTYSNNEAGQNYGFCEHRYALDKTRLIKSISFDYVISGTVEPRETEGEGVFQIKNAAGKYIDVISGNDCYIEDGQWHTISWENTDGDYIENLLVKLHHFNGEFLIANLVVEYVD